MRRTRAVAVFVVCGLVVVALAAANVVVRTHGAKFTENANRICADANVALAAATTQEPTSDTPTTGSSADTELLDGAVAAHSATAQIYLDTETALAAVASRPSDREAVGQFLSALRLAADAYEQIPATADPGSQEYVAAVAGYSRTARLVGVYADKIELDDCQRLFA